MEISTIPQMVYDRRENYEKSATGDGKHYRRNGIVPNNLLRLCLLTHLFSISGWPTSNAQIEIRTNMNKKSVLALEYLNIVNTNVQTPECTKAVPPPPTTVATTVLPPTETVPTYTFTSDEWTTTSEPFYPTDEWYPLPNDAVSVSPKMVSWLVLGGSISFIVLAIILALIFVFIIRPRHRARILHVTMPNNNSNTIPLDEKNDAYVQTLPRLHVHHDPISGPYISGVTSIKHLEETDAKLN